MNLKKPLIYLLVFVICSMININVESLGGPKGFYSNEWLLKTNGGRSRAKSLAENHGFQIIKETPEGYFILVSTDEKPPSLKPDEPMVGLPKNSQDEYMTQLQYLQREPRSQYLQREPRSQYLQREPRSLVINDSAWSSMWHVHEDKFPSMGVYNVWRRGFSGNGIHISVLDDGVEPDHSDLAENYDASRSYDYLTDSNFVNHSDFDFHGTWCAGVSSAAMNDFCVVGMAHMSTFGAVKIFDTFFGLNDADESLALVHELSHTDIYSNSWGPIDDGETFEGPRELAKNALKTAVTEGRNGLGAIYTWAAGNGGIYDDCNCDGYAGSIYTISVTSIGRDQAPSWYSEECSSILVGTYSGDSPDLAIATTDTGGGCTDRFQGTSASCPMAAGIIALILEANPTLSWRDIQHLTVETATQEGLIGGNWQKNGAEHKVSHAFGFGIMNAEAMLDAALDWQNVPEQITCESDLMAVNRLSDNGMYVVEEHMSDGCVGFVRFLEHVEVTLTFQATYRGSLEITLVSPFGTRSRLLRPRRFDVFNGTTDWTFMTVHNWGEFAAGLWTIQLETTDSATVFGLESWKLILYGTESATTNNPLANVSQEPVDDDDDITGPVVGAFFGGLALSAVVAAIIYFLVLKKPVKTIHPTTSNGQANLSYM